MSSKFTKWIFTIIYIVVGLLGVFAVVSTAIYPISLIDSLLLSLVSVLVGVGITNIWSK